MAERKGDTRIFKKISPLVNIQTALWWHEFELI